MSSSQSYAALFDLSGQSALVVGGARHLGRDAANVLAAAGAAVAVTSRSEENAVRAAREISEEYGVETLGLSLDHTRAAAVEEVFNQVAEWRERFDVVVNNAGGGTDRNSGKLVERAAEDIERLIATNLTGTLFCCQAAARRMLPNRKGKIINIASIAGMCGRDRTMYYEGKLPETIPDYAAAKAGIIGLTRDVAAILGPKGIYVNCISPGGFERGQPDRFIELYSKATALRRLGRDGLDMKGPILFLASAASDYVTGHNLVVDGGFVGFK